MGRAVKQDDARTLAFRVLLEVGRARSESRAPEVLAEGLAASGLDGRDKGLATELAYGVLRWQRALDHLIAPHVTQRLEALEPAARVWLRLGAYQFVFLDRIPAEIAVSATQDAARAAGYARLTGLVNAVLRKVLAAWVAGGRRPPDALASLPDWIVAELGLAYGDAAGREAAALRERAMTTLRPTRGKGGVEVARAALVAAGLEVHDAPHGYLAVAGDATRTNAWRDGLVVAQDPAGAVVVDGVGPGQRVLDLCAGRGIKTTALADLGADVVAVDIGERKLGELRALAARLGVERHVVATQMRDATAPLDDLGLFDEVLVDAPCSGLGTLRRHPEIAWRRGPDDVAQLVALQAALLANAAARVRPGGRLTYAVCSFVRVEVLAPLQSIGFEVVERRETAPSSGMDAFQVVRFPEEARMKLSVCLMVWLGLVAGACTSNPTPHPAADAGLTAQTGGGDDTMGTTDFGPDDDNDGIADCLELNGTWNGESCNTLAPSDGDAVGGDSTPEPDAGDGDDGADGYDEDGDDDDDGADAP